MESTKQFVEGGATKTEMLETIHSAYINSITRSSKAIYRCELTDNYYKVENELSIISENTPINIKRLKGINYLNNHHCYGAIAYHPDNEYLFKYAEAYKEFHQNMITTHTLQGRQLNIKRTNGEVIKVDIQNDNPIRIYKDSGDVRNLIIQVRYGESDEFTKPIPFFGYEHHTGKYIDGFISLNPEVFDKDFVLYIGYEEHDLLEDEREAWKDRIRFLLNDMKCEFYTYKNY